jgi:hypothetical protein
MLPLADLRIIAVEQYGANCNLIPPAPFSHGRRGSESRGSGRLEPLPRGRGAAPRQRGGVR